MIQKYRLRQWWATGIPEINEIKEAEEAAIAIFVTGDKTTDITTGMSITETMIGQAMKTTTGAEMIICGIIRSRMRSGMEKTEIIQGTDLDIMIKRYFCNYYMIRIKLF